jgi:hypothetical protein
VNVCLLTALFKQGIITIRSFYCAKTILRRWEVPGIISFEFASTAGESDGTGRHAGLRIQCLHRHGGSNPPSRTITLFAKRIQAMPVLR